MTKKVKYLIAALALCVAAPVIAAQDPAPPTNLQSEDQIIAWAKAAKLTDDTANPAASWNILGALDEGLLWASAGAPDAQGIAKVGVRLERFRPAAGIRSEAEMFELNCGSQQIRGTFNAAFAEHNFGGAKTDRAVNNAWAPVASNEIVSAIKDEACKAPVRSASAGAPAININDPAALRAWLNKEGIRDRNVGGNAEQWSTLGATNLGMVMTQLARRNTETRTAFIHVRTELFSPGSNDKMQGILSQSEEYEVTCTNNRIRQTGTTWYANHNLMGANAGEQKLTDWTPVAQHPILAKAGADLCRELQVRRDFQTGVRGSGLRGDEEEDNQDRRRGR